MLSSISNVLLPLGFLFTLSSLVSPSSVFACAVCFTAKEETLNAYYGTAILLSILPLAMVGGIIYWVYRQYKEASSTDISGHSS